MLNRCQCLFLSLFFPLLLASFFFCFRLFHAYELVEDDVGEGEEMLFIGIQMEDQV